MGCVSSQPAPVDGPPNQNLSQHKDEETIKAVEIDKDLDRARQQEEQKVKLLLLGAGESGKSTILKQLRILHGAPRTEDEQRMYGVVIRSNVINAVRKLCSHLRTLGLEDQLAEEPIPEDDFDCNMTPKQAYDLIVEHVVDNRDAPEDLEKPLEKGERDWIGVSPRAGLVANNDAKQFLKFWKPIKILWEVSLRRKIRFRCTALGLTFN
jgi:hypothetical protein